MDLRKGARSNQTIVSFENTNEAKLFVSEGLDTISVKGIQLALRIKQADAENGSKPIEITVSNNRLADASNKMSQEAARLLVYADQTGFEEYPNAVENALSLREMKYVTEDYFRQTI